MPLVIPPGFGQASYVITGPDGTEPYVTTLGHNLNLGDNTAAEYANDLFTAYAQNIMPITGNTYALDRVSLFVGDDGPSGSVDSTLPPVTGASSGTRGPTAMSPILRKTTGELGRRGRGRMFLPGVILETEADADGSITVAGVTRINTAAAAWYARLTDDTDPSFDLSPVLFHSLAPFDPTPITGFNTAPLVGWIRGRIR